MARARSCDQQTILFAVKPLLSTQNFTYLFVQAGDLNKKGFSEGWGHPYFGSSETFHILESNQVREINGKT